MAEHSSQPVKTFSIGFEEDGFNELPYAREVALRFGTEHHELIVRPRAGEVLPELVWHLDEPMADASALPSYYVAQMARRHVTVVLNGDGGDESFAGYNTHRAVMAYHRYQSIPGWARRGLVEVLLKALPNGQSIDHPLSRARRLVAQSNQSLENQYSRWMNVCSAEIRNALYSDNFANLLRSDVFERNGNNKHTQVGPLDWMLRSDTLNYLPGDLLVKMDRMTMAHSLEARSPLLDQEVVQFAAKLPEAYKRKGRLGKRVLTAAFRNFLSPSLLGRPKHGFSVPVDRWLRNGLKSMAADIVLSRRARERGLFSPESVLRLWNKHQEGTQNYGHQLWALVVMELWQRQFVDVPAPTKN
jgi:asparagine synthase (glutamine-hydrolysing)